MFFLKNFTNIKQAVFVYKIEFFYIFIFTVAFLSFSKNFLDENFACFLFYPAYIIIIYLFRFSKITYAFSAFLPVLGTFLIFFFDKQQYNFTLSDKFWAMYFILVVIFLSCKFTNKDSEFMQCAVNKICNFVFSILFAHIFSFMVVLIFAGIDYLLGFYIFDNSSFYVYGFSWIGLVPSSFFMLEVRNFEYKISRFFKIILNFALTPAFVIYTILLYVYIAKIAIFLDLPKGGVAIIVILYLCFGILISSFQLIIKDQKFAKFWNLFPLLSIAPLLLFWIGIYARILQYGFTNDRILLVAIAICLSFVFILKIFGFFRLKFLSFILIFIAFFLYFILNITQISLSSQADRLYKKLDEFGLLDQNKSAKFITKEQIDLLNQDKKEALSKIAWDIFEVDHNYKINQNENLLEFLLGRFINQDIKSQTSFYLAKVVLINELYRYDSIFSIADDGNFNIKDKILQLSLQDMLITIDIKNHINNILKSRGLDPLKFYTQEKFEEIADDLLVFKSDQGDVVANKILIKYTKDEGYEVVNLEKLIFLKTKKEKK